MTSYQANGPVSVEGYGVAVGASSSDPFITVFSTRDPTTNDVNYPVKKRWLNLTTPKEWILTGFNNTTGQTLANWLDISDFSAGVIQSFTPQLQFGGNNVGMVQDPVNTFGAFVQFGKLVYVYGQVVLTNNGSSTGKARVISSSTPLPTASLSFPSTISMTMGVNIDLDPGYTSLYGFIQPNTSFFQIFEQGASQGSGAFQITHAYFVNNSSFEFAGMYFTL